MNTHGKRRLIVTGVAGAALLASSFVGVAAASALTGSVPSNGATGSGLRALATVSAAQASAAAIAAVPGTADSPELIYDQGYVVYRVIITAADGTRTEVIVDGGNDVVLAQYAPNWSGVIGDSSAGSDAVASTTATAPTGPAATATAATTPSTSSSGFTGSILSNGGAGSTLRALATVSSAQAGSAAVAAVPGIAGSPELIYDNGYVVYRVIVTAADGTRTEVIVDGGSGMVLAQYAPSWSGVLGDSSAGTDADAAASTTATATAATATATTTPSTTSYGFAGSIASNGALGSALRARATVTTSQASVVAVAAVPGTAGAPELITDNGYVVYRVIVTAADSTRTEVIVDGGNGAVLAQYAPNWSGVIGDSSAGSDVGATAQA